MIAIRKLEDLPLPALYETFNEAFAGYMVSWTEAEFSKMLIRRGFHPALSFGAFDDGRLVSFTFNGIGTFNGRATAYDTGTGTIASHRGQGLAGRIFSESISPLKQAGVAQYLLEVLQDNEIAIGLYKKQGFEICRSLNVFRLNIADWKKRPISADPSLHLRKIDLADANSMEALWDFQPSWQNTFNALWRQPENFIVTGAFLDDELAGYGIIEPASGDIPQLVVHPRLHRRKIGTRILHALGELNKAEILKVVNTDAAHTSITDFLTWNGIPKVTAQFEMIRSL